LSGGFYPVSKGFFNFSLRPKAAEFYCLNTTYSFCKFLETFFFPRL
jgi:hypothetical protein